MVEEPKVGARVWFPPSWGSDVETEMYRVTPPKGFAYGEKQEPIEGAREVRGWVGVPYSEGLRLIDYFSSSCRDATTEGAAVANIPFAEPWDRIEGQDKFMNELDGAWPEEEVMMAQAPTGFGKTVCALRAAAKLGRQTMVIVPKANIMEQWVKAAIEIAGIPEGWVGRWQGKKKQTDRAIVVAVIHNLVQKPLTKTELREFGTVIWDECHVLGARTFSETLGMFPARYRLGLSATPYRKDGLDALFKWTFGESPRVVAEGAAPMSCRVYTLTWNANDYFLDFCDQVNHSPSLMDKMLGCMVDRNEMLASTIDKAWDKGHKVLGVSNSRAQLVKIKELLEKVGISSIGYYVRQHPETNKKQNQKALDEAAKCDVVLATYGMASMALDIPDLSCGVELSPRSEGTQLIGRVRRAGEKREPVWFTVRDLGVPLYERRFQSRMTDFESAGATIK